MHPFAIAIPSYQRPHTLRRKTLRLLNQHGFYKGHITIFVADEAERQLYDSVLNTDVPSTEQPYRLVVGELGIHNQRRFIHDYYPEGARVLCLDDDVSGILSLYPHIPFPEQVLHMFALADAAGCRLWGIYPSSDTRNLKDRAVVGRVYCIGACFGMTNWRGTEYPHQTTEDFTRTLDAEARDGNVIRFEGLAPVTRYFKEPGGLQLFRTPEIQAAEMRALVARWPDKVALRHKHGDWVDVRFKRRVQAMLEHPMQPLQGA